MIMTKAQNPNTRLSKKSFWEYAIKANEVNVLFRTAAFSCEHDMMCRPEDPAMQHTQNQGFEKTGMVNVRTGNSNTT
jgi:hypothetical protein